VKNLIGSGGGAHWSKFLGANQMNARMQIDLKENYADRLNQIAKIQEIYDLSICKCNKENIIDVENWLSTTVKLRRLREKYFKSNLFADPAWDILLDLAIARKTQKKISVSSLCIAASVPTTTALRKIKEMLSDGLIYKKPDKNDKRRTYIEISDQTYERMLSYISESAKLAAI
jgi:DNA-binding MarR family transcriptional regulator